MPLPDPITRAAAIRRVLGFTLAGNLLVASLKLVFGTLAHAASLQADGLHATLDGSSNIVALLGMRLAAAPPDREHPYGHRKFETLATLAIALFLLLGLVEIASSAVASLKGSHPPVVAPHVFAILALTFAVNLAVARYEHREALRLQSELLRADAGHTSSDALATLVVAASLASVRLGIPWADPLAAFFLLGFVAHTAWSVVRSSTRVLADERVLAPGAIRHVVLAVPGVRGAHKIRSRGSTDHVFVDLHIQLDPAMTVRDAHTLTHHVKDAVIAALPSIRDVVIHTEPADGRERSVDPPDEPPPPR